MSLLPVPLRRDVDDPDRLADGLLATLPRIDGRSTLAYWKERWLRHDGRRWEFVGDTIAKQLVHEHCLAAFEAEFISGGRGKVRKLTPATESAVLNALSLKRDVLLPDSVTLHSWLDGRDAGRVFAVRNGLLDLSGREPRLLSHSPQWFATSIVGFDFDPGATCPTWLVALGRMFPDDADAVALLQEWFGYCLVPDTDAQSFLMLVGDGNNGKSVICAALTAMLGEGNVSAVPLDSLHERFALFGTLGKLANVCADVGTLNPAALAKLKNYTSGDRMPFEEKGVQAIEAIPTARLTYSTNALPVVDDASNGFWRRMIALPLTHVIAETERIAGLDKAATWAKLGELSGLLNWAIEGLQRLRARGMRFVVPESAKKTAEAHRNECEPERAFLSAFVAKHPGEALAVSDVYSAYTSWYDKQSFGRRYPASRPVLGKAVSRLFGVKSSVVTEGRQTGRVYQGLMWAIDGVPLFKLDLSEAQHALRVSEMPWITEAYIDEIIKQRSP